jgi:hypothetical protein
LAQIGVRAEPGNEISSLADYGVEDLLFYVEAASDPVGHHQTGKLTAGIGNLLKVEVHPGISAGLICRKIRWRLRGVYAERPTASSRNDSKNRHLHAFFDRPASDEKNRPWPPRLCPAFRQKAAVEHPDG